jgi:hypothetical protein
MKSLQKHALWILLKDCLKLSDEQLCKELNVRGHDVSADKLAAMMAGFEPMPESIEKALKHVGAEHLFFAEHVLNSARVEELIGPWYHMHEHSPAADCRPAFEGSTDFLDDL